MNRNRKPIRLTESQLNSVIKESVKRCLYEMAEAPEATKYYWIICELKRVDGYWEPYKDVEYSENSDDASAESFGTPEEAYMDGLRNLECYFDGHYSLQIYYFTDNGAGEYADSCYAEIHNGKITER